MIRFAVTFLNAHPDAARAEAALDALAPNLDRFVSAEPGGDVQTPLDLAPRPGLPRSPPVRRQGHRAQPRRARRCAAARRRLDVRLGRVESGRHARMARCCHHRHAAAAPRQPQSLNLRAVAAEVRNRRGSAHAPHMRGSHLDGRRRRHRRTSRFRRPAAVLAAGRADLAQLPGSGASRCPRHAQLRPGHEGVRRAGHADVRVPGRPSVTPRRDPDRQSQADRPQARAKAPASTTSPAGVWMPSPRTRSIKGGTVIHSYWSGVADNANAPSVKVGKK